MTRTYLDRGRPRTVETRLLPDGSHEVLVDGVALHLRVERMGEGCIRLMDPDGARPAWVTVDGPRTFVTLDGRDYVFETAVARRRAQAHEGASGEVTMPMPGLVISVAVKDGDVVKRGQPLVVVEAMKMEHTLRSPLDGVVRRLAAVPGEKADAGAVLLEIGD